MIQEAGTLEGDPCSPRHRRPCLELPWETQGLGFPRCRTERSASVPRQQAVWCGTSSNAWRLCNRQPSVTQKQQQHKALSNGLRRCSSCLEPAASQQFAWGAPAEPAAEHRARSPSLQGQGEAPGRDPGSSGCCGGGFPLWSPRPSHYSDLPGVFPAKVAAREPTPTF